jgi:hypothetical protein
MKKTKTSDEPVFTALSIAPAELPREYYLIELAVQGDNILAQHKTGPFPFHIAVMEQKMRSARIWTGAAHA